MLQRCNNHCDSILYEEQRLLVSERLSGSCQSNSDDIFAIKNGMDNVNLPETWTKAENLHDLELDIFIIFGHSAYFHFILSTLYLLLFSPSGRKKSGLMYACWMMHNS
jgi:hypothetical protein